MAKKEETVSLIDTFSEFKELKNIDRTTMVSVLEESFRSVIAKMFGTDENYDVIVNPVSFQEKAVKKKPLVINGQEIHIGVELLWGVFIIATILLSIQNAYLRKKNKQLKEDIER